MTLEAPRPVVPSPEDFNPKVEKKNNKLRNTLIIGGTSIALAAGAVVGISAANQAPKNEPVAEAPAEPVVENPQVNEGDSENQPQAEQPVAPEGNVDVTQLPENVLTYNMFEKLPENVQEKLLSLDTMSLADFRQQPYEDQLMFGDYILDNNSEITTYRLSKNGIVNLESNANPSTPQELYSTLNYQFAMLSSLKEYTPDDGVVFDNETAKKASVIVANPENLEYQGYIDSRIDEWGASTAMELTTSKVVAGEIDGDGVAKMNIESPSGNKTYDVSSPKKFVNYLGQSDQIYTTDLSVISTDVRYTDLSK